MNQPIGLFSLFESLAGIDPEMMANMMGGGGMGGEWLFQTVYCE